MLITREICDELSDEEIVIKSLSQVDFFSCLYDRYELRLLTYINRIATFSPQESEDILQDAFIKIWRNLNDYNPGSKLSTWVYRIVHNETISVWRKNKSFGKDQKASLHENLISESPEDFEDQQNKEKNDTRIHKILNQLPLKYKTVLVLKYLEGLSYEDISDILKIPEGTVATRINRAKKAFAKVTSEKNISFFE